MATERHSLVIWHYFGVRPGARLTAAGAGTQTLGNQSRKLVFCGWATLGDSPNRTAGTIIQEMVGVPPECRTRIFAGSLVRVIPPETIANGFAACFTSRHAVTERPTAFEGVVTRASAEIAAISEGSVVPTSGFICSFAINWAWRSWHWGWWWQRSRSRSRRRGVAVRAHGIDSVAAADELPTVRGDYGCSSWILAVALVSADGEGLSTNAFR